MSQDYGNFSDPPGGGYQIEDAQPPGKVTAPAIALIVVGALNTLYGLWVLIQSLAGANEGGELPPEMRENPEFVELYEKIEPFSSTISLSVSLIVTIAGALILFAGIRMLKLRSYGLAVTGSILAAIPCISIMACCGIGEAVGIWALVVLMSPDVKVLFR